MPESEWLPCTTCGETKPVFMYLAEGNAPYCHDCGPYRIALEVFPTDTTKPAEEPHEPKRRMPYREGVDDWHGHPPACPLCNVAIQGAYFQVLVGDPHEAIPSYIIVCDSCGDRADVHERVGAIE